MRHLYDLLRCKRAGTGFGIGCGVLDSSAVAFADAYLERCRDCICARGDDSNMDTIDPAVAASVAFCAQLYRPAVVGDGDVVLCITIAAAVFRFVAGDVGDDNIINADRRGKDEKSG
jgi:hypothetical protein